MSYQENDYKCCSCASIYIPFIKGVVCPKCGAKPDTNEYYDFIEGLGLSMFGHKLRYGQFVPFGWYGISIKSRIEIECFDLFDRCEIKKPKDELRWLEGEVLNIKIPDKYEYLRKQIQDIVGALYPLYKRKNRFQPSKFRYWLAKKMRKLMEYLP
jgi:hypothetical protein